MHKILLIFTIFMYCIWAQDVSNSVTEFTSENFYQYHNKGNWIIEFNRNGLASVFLDRLVEWKNSKSYNINIAKLNIDKHTDVSNIIDGSPAAPYPHYMLFYDGLAISFVGSADFETVSEFIEGFIQRNTQAVPQTGEETTSQTSESIPQTEESNEQQIDGTDQIVDTTDQTQPVDATIDPNVVDSTQEPLVDGIDQTVDPNLQDQNAEYTYDPNDPNAQYDPNVVGTEDNYEVVFNPETGQYEYVFPDITLQDETGAEIQQDGELPTDEVERQLESDAVDAPVEGTTQDNTADGAVPTDTTQDIPVQETVIAPAPANPDEVDETNIVVLTNANFDERISSGVWFIEFYAPWCGFCKRLIPTWAQLANTFKDDSNINIAKLDATENDVAERFNVRGYPTLLFLRDGQVYDYEGERDINSFVNFINNGYLNSTSTPIPSKSPEINQEDVVLNSSNFASSVSTGVWLVEFYAPWCGFCKQLTPVWAQLATELKAEGINVAKVDVDVEKELSLTYNIEYLPTIYVITDKKLYKQDGEKDRQSLLDFARGGYKSVVPTDMPSAEVDESDIFVLNDSNYKNEIEKGAWFIEFYAPWCGFCKKLKPTWAQLATKFKNNQNVRIAMSDATENTELAEKFGVESFPTIYLYLNGRKYPFGGNRTVESFSSFIESEYKEVEHKSLPLDSTNILDSDVIILDDKNLTSSIGKGEWLIEFYAPWCGFCKTLKPIYSNLATYVKNKYDSKFNVAKLDVDQNGQMAAAFGIRYLPTIFYVKDGKLYKNNRGRSFDDIFKFATETVNDDSQISFPLPNFVENPKFDEKDVTVLTDANFDATVKNSKFWLIEFYAPWCGHCKKLAPNWASLATFAKQRMGADFGIAKIDGPANPKVAEKFDDIQGYPTILFLDTEKNTYVEYEGGRSIPEFYEFLTEERTKVAEDKIKKVYESVEEKNKAKADGVDELVAADFYDKVSTGIWLVEFYAPWCGFCKRLAPEYAQFHKTVKAEWDSKYHVGKVNVDVEKALGEHFNIEYLPTLLVLTEGKAYKLEGAGNANAETLSKFLKEDYLTVTPKPFERKEITEAPAAPPTPAPAPPSDVSEEDVVVLSDSDFVPTGKISSGIWFVEFYAPWCGFCKQLTPVWAQLAKDLKAEGGNIHVAKLDATIHEQAAAIFSVTGYPTLIVIENGKFVEYLGGRELEDMKKYLKGVYQGQTLTAFKYLDGTVAAKEDVEAPPSGIEDDSDVVVLKDSNFFNKISTGTWIVDFYAPWCGHCKVLAPKWNLLAKQLKGKVNVGKVDITTEERLSQAFGPKYLPTIYLIHNGFFYKFDGKREVPELTHFAQVSYKKFDAKKLPPAFMSVEESSAEYLITLTDENFWPQISKGEWFIEFYAPWCGFCKQLAPIYTQFSFEAHTSIPSLSVAQVNAEDNSVASSFNVRSYPTLIFLKDGKYYNFEGLRTVEGMSEFSKTGYLKTTGVDVPEQPVIEIRPKESRERKVFTKKVGNIQQLDNTNFDRLTSSGNWLISFNVPYDGFSKQLNNVLADLTDSSFNIKVSVGSVDTVKNPTLADRFSITKFPTLVLFREDNQYVLDSSITNLAKIKEFIESKYKSSPSTKRTRVANHDEL